MVEVVVQKFITQGRVVRPHLPPFQGCGTRRSLLRVINCFSAISTMYYEENTVVTCVVFHLKSLIASEWRYLHLSQHIVPPHGLVIDM